MESTNNGNLNLLLLAFLSFGILLHLIFVFFVAVVILLLNLALIDQVLSLGSLVLRRYVVSLIICTV